MQALHVTLMLYHFMNNTLFLVMRPNLSPLSLVLLPQTGNTALIFACEKGYVNVVEKLLAAGADPNHQDIVRNLVTMVILIHVPNA